ncbi:hypothetical protein LI82_02635 [Methanococcoides methylutens]|uniref:SpoVT-AbrB domain-containing protein n=1 Tax=Methanococcoides methylutens TaxID=2226 RepID=A0A099T440_METMT|nr:AbrB/MazE/SpoVT family DNA-binding domain-containing protein [Methanococcoides methylutens]KGK98958.1 hypothetical protein LI82_02635 [Methanococcoides methylutens]
MLKNIRTVSGAQMGVLRICLPPALAANAGINPGGKVAITIEKGKLVVSPIPGLLDEQGTEKHMRTNSFNPPRSK